MLTEWGLHHNCCKARNFSQTEQNSGPLLRTHNTQRGETFSPRNRQSHQSIYNRTVSPTPYSRISLPFAPNLLPPPYSLSLPLPPASFSFELTSPFKFDHNKSSISSSPFGSGPFVAEVALTGSPFPSSTPGPPHTLSPVSPMSSSTCHHGEDGIAGSGQTLSQGLPLEFRV